MKFSIKFPILLGHLTQSVLIVLRASVLRALISLHFQLPLENNKSMPFVTIFYLKQLYDKMIVNSKFFIVKFITLLSLGPHGRDQICKEKKQYVLLYFHTWQKKWMHALIYIIKTKCAVIKHSTYFEKIYGPWVQTLGRDQYGKIVKMY